MTVHVNQRDTVPSAFVTKGKHRVKQYDSTIYLKNGDEFELELFNPTSKKVLAKISLNDISLGSGIVLRPGERVFLERYLDEARKFIFETYNVEGNNSAVKEAIKNNGKVEVEFFDEYTPPNYWHGWNYGNITYTNDPGTFTINNTGDCSFVGHTLTSNCMQFSGDITFDANVELSGSLDMVQCCATNINEEVKNLEETGRIEKGEVSEQTFEYDNTSFNSYYSWRSEWKILPVSQKAYVKEDLAVYCTGCGRKRRKTDNFCAKCGKKY